MDLGSLSVSVCVMMVCLLGAASCSNGDNNCPCPEIPTHPLTQPPEQKCYQIDNTFRYNCVEGYVREAGTSNLIICSSGNNGAPVWSKYKLSCIPDPKKPATQPPKTTVTKQHTDTPHDSIITTTVTSPTSQQIIHSESISASMTTITESTEPTSSGPDQWSLSDLTQSKTLLVTHEVESVMVTSSAASSTTSTSTTTLSLMSTVKNNSTLIHGRRTGLNSTTAAVIACVSLVIIFAVIGISLLFYRRRWRSKTNMPPQTEEEVIPMKHVPSELTSQCL